MAVLTSPREKSSADAIRSSFSRSKAAKMFAVFVAALMLLICVAPAVSFGIDPKAPPSVSADDTEDEEEEQKGPIYDPYDFDNRQHETEVPAGWIGIYSIEDLAKIGVDSGYPLSASYIQMADIDFTKASSAYLSSRGYEIKVTATISSTHIIFQIQYKNNGSSDAWTNASDIPLRYNFGKVATNIANTDASGQYTISNADSGYGSVGYSDMIFTIGGTMNGEDFAFSMEVPEGMTTGTVVKESYQKGNFNPIGDNSDGTSATRFTGKFNGNNYDIKGLETAAYSSTEAYAGLFGYADGAELSNIGIVAVQNGTKGVWGSQTAILESLTEFACAGGLWVRM